MVNVVSSLLGIIAAGAISPAQPVSIQGLQSLDDTLHHSVQSETLDRPFDILVGLPDGYDASGDTEYPTIYILDGGAFYPLLRSYHNYLNVGEEAPDAILVAISYGNDDFENGNNRSHDYTAPSEEREYWGGAEAFQGFLRDELIPFIEGAYRSQADRRLIFGQSIGGQFVLYTAQTQPRLFWGHIASNPALHRNLPLFLQMHPDVPADAERSRLFVGSGSDDDPQFREPALQWMDHWVRVEDKPWELLTKTLEGHSHFSAPPATYRAAMHWLFGN